MSGFHCAQREHTFPLAPTLVTIAMSINFAHSRTHDFADEGAWYDPGTNRGLCSSFNCRSKPRASKQRPPKLCGTVFPDLVRPFACGVPGRLDLLPSLAAGMLTKPRTVVRLPTCDLHDISQRGALGALHHGDDFGFLVGTVRFRLAGRPLGAARFLRALGFLGLARAFVAGASAAGVLVFSDSMFILLFSFCPKLVAVVTVITPVGRNGKQNR